jgi:hypothetical protein
MTIPIPLRAALADPNLLGLSLTGDSWRPWRVLLIAAMGEALTASERALFTQLTQRAHEPNRRVEEAAFVVGRRGGKSCALATLATYIAALCEHRLSPGEVGVLLCIAPDQRQAAICLEYANAALAQSPLLRQLIVRRTADTIELSNHVRIEVRASNFRRLRGPTYIAVLADEAAFWLSDEVSSNPDIEIINAVRPGLATTGGPLIIASSPYARRGLLWAVYRQHFGLAGDPLILVAQGATRVFNSSLPQAVVDRALTRDPASAKAEYGAEFRTDIESFITREVIEACVESGVRERPPLSNTKYQAFVDPSGGSSSSMTLAIGHRQGDIAIVDALREIRPPFSPEAVVSEFARTLKSYRVTKVEGDKYAGEFPRELFRRHGITYELSAKSKSDIYRDTLPILNSRRAELLDSSRLITQLCSLERRTARGGRDSIDCGPGGHDDVANATAGLLVKLLSRKYNSDWSWVTGDRPDMSEADRHRAWRQRELNAYIVSGAGTRPPWSY